jgi:hypothetical protein
MANKKLKNIFLSASIPYENRKPIYYETADIIAIRDSVIALTSVIIPNHRLIWGGHPSITPIINHVIKKSNLNIQNYVRLYQTRYYEHLFPEDNNEFKNITLTENINSSEKDSIYYMRERMFKENIFDAAVFIGGMEGIEEEFKMFKEFYPKALLLPVASTGGATKIVYEEFLPEEFKNERLIKDYGYMSLFQKLLIDKI